jgi:hypothetical protein
MRNLSKTEISELKTELTNSEVANLIMFCLLLGSESGGIAYCCVYLRRTIERMNSNTRK